MSRVLPGMFVASLLLFGMSHARCGSGACGGQHDFGRDSLSHDPARPCHRRAREGRSGRSLDADLRSEQPGKAARVVRPLLPALYVAQGALQAMDVHSTYSAISGGAHEATPLMKNVVGNKGAMLAVKAGVAASTIWMAESMWKRGNRVGAIVTMIAANSVTGFVVAHNYKLARQLR